MPGTKELYDKLYAEKLYTNSYQEFVNKYGSEEGQDELYNKLHSNKLYTKDVTSFKTKYFSDLKKKETGVSPSGPLAESGSQVSQPAVPPGPQASSVTKVNKPSAYNKNIEATDWQKHQEITKKIQAAAAKKDSNAVLAAANELKGLRSMYGDAMLSDKNLNEDLAITQKLVSRNLPDINITTGSVKPTKKETISVPKPLVTATGPTKERAKQQDALDKFEKSISTSVDITDEEAKYLFTKDMIQLGFTEEGKEKEKEIDESISEEFSDNEGVLNSAKKLYNKFLTSANASLLLPMANVGMASEAKLALTKAADELAREKPDGSATQEEIIERAKSIRKGELSSKASSELLEKSLRGESSFLDNYAQWWYMNSGNVPMPEEFSDLEKTKFAIKSVIEKTDLKNLEFRKKAKDLQDIISELNSVDAKNLTPENASYYKQLIDKANAMYVDLNENYRYLDNDLSNLSDFKNELDLFKRNYSTVTNLMGKTIISGIRLSKGLVGAAGMITPGTDFDEISSGMEAVASGLESTIERKKSIDDINDVGSFFRVSGEILADQLPQLVINAYTGGAAKGLAVLGASAAGSKYQEIKDDEDYSQSQKMIASVGVGLFEVMSEKVEANVLKRALPSARVAAAAANGATKLELDALKSEMTSGIRGVVKSTIDKVGSTVLNANQEGISELIAQVGGNMVDKYVLNNKKVGILDGVKDAYLTGAIMGGAITASPIIASKIITPFINDTDAKIRSNSKKIQELSASLEKVTSQESKDIISESINKLKRDNEAIINGGLSVINKMTPEEIREGVANFEEIQKIKSQFLVIKGDKNLTDAEKKSAMAPLNARYDELVQRRQEIINKANAIQEQGSGQVPVQPETRTSEKVEQRVPESESQVATEQGEKEEVKIDKVSISTNTKKDVDTIKSSSSETETGQTFNLDGTVYSEGGLVVPVASENLTQEELTPERIADFVEANSGSIGDQNVKVGIYKFPNSNEVSIDLNIVVPKENRDAAIEFGRQAGQESLFDLDTFENIKTGSDGKNPIKFTGEQFKQISRDLKNGKVPNLLAPKQKPQATTKTKLGQNIKKAVAKVFPDMNVAEFKTAKEMKEYVAKKYGKNVAKDFSEDDAARAVFMDGKIVEVLVNEELSDETTMPHEIWHGILAKAFGENEPLFKQFRESIDKALRDNGYEDIADALDAFAINPEYVEQGVMSEEWLAQLGGMLANAGINPKNMNTEQKSLLQQIKSIVNKFAKAITGQQVFLEDATPENILDFMVSISDSLSRGEDISGYFAQAASTQTTINEPVSTKASKKINFKDNYPLSFVTDADKIDIYEFIKKAVAEKKKIWFWVADQLGRGMYFDQVINGEHYLDAGPSFALDPENRDEGVLWATSKGEKWINDNIKNSDYILFISGSSQNSKAFNVAVNDLVKKRIETSIGKLAGKTINVGSKSKLMSIKIPKGDAFESFKSVINEILKDTTGADSFEKNLSGFKGEVNRSKSFDDIFKSTLRKDFLLYINSMASKSTPLADFLNKIGATIDLNNLRDGFYLENNFELGDVMLIGKPTGFGGKSKHSTYHNNVLGEVIGVPDRKVSSFDIAPTEIKEQLKKLTSTQAISKIAPYGSGISEISEPEVTTKAQKKDHPYIPDEVFKKLTTDENGDVVFNHYSRVDIDEVRPSTGANSLYTSKEEKQALASVGGLAMFYTQVGQKESHVGDIQNTVVVDPAKVYYFNKDPLNFYDEAKEQFLEHMNRGKKDRINYAFSANYQVAWITKVANENGFDMVISKWRDDYDFRAQTKKTLKTLPENISLKKEEEESFDIGDKILLMGKEVVLTGKDENGVYSYEGVDTSGKVPLMQAKMSGRYGNITMLEKGNHYVDQENRKIVKITSNAQKSRLNKEIDGVIAKSEKRGASKSVVYSNALNYLQKSKYYEEASDSERESLVRELRAKLGIKEKKSPTVNRILGAIKDITKITVNEYTALKNQIRLENKAAKGKAAELNNLRKELSLEVAMLAKAGKITTKQAATIIKRLGSINLENPSVVDKFVDYMVNVFNNANYADSLNTAMSNVKKIKRFYKGKDVQASTYVMAKNFLMIDPKMVDNIDEYIAMSNEVMNAVMPTSTGSGLKMRVSADIKKIQDYTEKEVKSQSEKLKQELLDEYQYLVDAGVLDASMSYDEIAEIIDSINDEAPQAVLDKGEDVRKYIVKMFNSLTAVGKDMLSTGVDSVTGNTLDLTDDQKSILKKFLNMDIENMSIKDAKLALEYLSNFLTNGVTDGMSGLVGSYVGSENLKTFKATGATFRKLKLFFSSKIGRAIGEELTNLNILLEQLLSGQDRSSLFRSLSGLNKVINGNAAARKKSSNKMTEYVKKFEKSKDFFTLENNVERGVLSFLIRTNESTDELPRRKGLIEQSIERLINGTEQEAELGRVVQETYERIGKNAETIQDVLVAASKENRDAVNWWIDTWGNDYDALRDVSLNVYNADLGKDQNYTPDSYSKIEEETEDEDLGKSAFMLTTKDYTVKKKTGVLMEAKKPNKLSKNRVVSFDFDTNNARSYEAALVDINTAEAIRVVDGFINSKEFSKLGSTEDARLLRRRINSYIGEIRGKNFVKKTEIDSLNKALDTIGSIGASMALGSISQPLKQVVPVAVNTIINTGGALDIKGAFNQDANDFIENSGMPIANRGLESFVNVGTANKYIEEASRSTPAKAVDMIKKASGIWLDFFLKRPDVFIARASFLSYYKSKLNEMGYETSNMDWKNHEPVQSALQYAQDMLDRQQNVSDAALMGDLMTSKDPMRQIVRKTVFTFMNFVLNQKARMYSDIITIRSNNATKSDKKQAARSLAALSAEMATYTVVGGLILETIHYGVMSLMGVDEDDEARRKRLKSRKETIATNIATDFLSPLPVTNSMVIAGLNNALDAYYKATETEDDEEGGERFRLFEKDKAGLFDNLGATGITITKWGDALELIRMGYTGEFTQEFNGQEKTKYLRDKDKNTLAALSIVNLGYNLGLLPAEASSVVRSATRVAKKRALSEDDNDTRALYKKNKVELPDYLK